MYRVYKVKYEKKPEHLLDLGYDFMPIDIVEKENVLFKIFKMPNDGPAIKLVIGVFNNPDWQENNLNIPGVLGAYEELGIKWEEYADEEGNVKKVVVEDENFIDMFTTWRIEIDMDDDRLLGFTTGDMSFPYTFYNRDILDTFCDDEIDYLFQEGILEIEELKEE